MLFYDKFDRICIKFGDYNYRLLLNDEIFELNNEKYLYLYEKFYKVKEFGDGELIIDYSQPIHERHLDIKEESEVIKY